MIVDKQSDSTPISLPVQNCNERDRPTFFSGKKKRNLDKPTIDETIMELRKKKMQLQNEILEKESYLKTLEILKLERELQVSSSKFTQSFPIVTYVIDAEEFPLAETDNSHPNQEKLMDT